MSGDETLPPALAEKPANRYKWDFPTAWLLGTRFVASLRDIAASAVFAVDPRDWMTASEVIDLRPKEKVAEYWIDFLADSGDSPRLVYQLAYLLQQPELAVNGVAEELPRGSVLFFGGDTAYPVATRRRLLERVRAPFIWARRDLEKVKRLSKRTDIKLFGIPGNHDYYNALAGFERLFHKRSCDNDTDQTQRVDLPGYVLEQRASYFAANLPNRWQLWGVDIETHDVDGLQLEYFKRAKKHAAFDGKLIVATSRPTFVNRGFAHDFKKISARLGEHQLDLEPAFFKNGLLEKERARLDLSGDTHLYERYWGKDLDSNATPATCDRPCPPSDRPVGPSTTRVRTNYASVVSGLGGAFHHPSQVRVRPRNASERREENAPRCSWPGGGASESAIGKQLLRPRKLFQAGAVGVIGIAIAMLTYPTQSNVLDLPFHPATTPWSRDTQLAHFLSVLTVALTIVILGAGSFGCLWVGRKLHSQVQEMGPPRNWWGRSTAWVSHHPAVWWLIRWLGGSRRNLWGVLITSPMWLLAAASWFGGIWALRCCDYLGSCNDGALRTYVILSILVLFLTGLGAWKWKGACGWFGLPFGAALGLVTALLIAWSPYAWAQLAGSLSWMTLFFFTQWSMRRALCFVDIFTCAVWLRRLVTVVALIATICVYVAMPICFADPEPVHSVWRFWLCALAGAYLSCQWMGWYFFTSLQWNAHGNEAGGAARIVKFAEFLRIKLTENSAEVWVIGVQDADDDGVTPSAHLIDHFSIEAEADEP